MLPLPKVTGIYQHECSKYPDKIKVPMSDGTVVTYYIDVKIPHPCFSAAMRSLERMGR